MTKSLRLIIPGFFLIVHLLGCKSADSHTQLSKQFMEFDFGDGAHQPIAQDSLIALLPTMTTRSLDCQADVYWKIIKRGETSIPLLIAGLTDTTLTNIYNECKQGRLNVGEVCYFALEEIAQFPAFVVTHIQFDLFTNDCWNFYDYLFDNRNKKEYQKMVRGFYSVSKYKFVKFDKKELTACRKQYGIIGKYKWVEKE